MSVQAAVAFLNGDKDDEPDTMTTTTPTTTHRPILPLSKIPSSTTNKSLFSAPSPPHQWHKSTTSIMKRTHQPTPRSVIDMHAEELTALYQEALDKLTTANATIAKLTSDVEIYACDSTKVRDYEIRVEYLAQKLEQVSEERDLLEQELVSYKTRHNDSLATPVSACFEPNQVFGGENALKKNPALPPSPPQAPETPSPSDNGDKDQHQHQQQQKEQPQQQQPTDDAYFDDLLDAYEETGDLQQQHVEEQMAKMQAEYDQGMKMAMESYVADLANQRLENKTLQTMVKKQEELIHKLEQQQHDPLTDHGQHAPANHDGENLLLHQQVELQQIELESKRELLTQLLNERNHTKQQRRTPSFRSSIDVLAEMAKAPPTATPKSPSSIRSLKQHHHHHQQRDTGRSTPPPFAPPKTPLPPLPAASFQNDSSISINNMGMTPTSASYSRSSTSSASWSSSLDEQQQQQQHQQQQQQHLPPQHPLSVIMAAPPPPTTKHTDMAPMIVQGPTDPTPAPAPASSGSFWKGLKKKF